MLSLSTAGCGNCDVAQRSTAVSTLRQFADGLQAVPAPVAWYLADLGEAKG